MNYSELQDFIKAVAKSGATEVRIDSADLKITIKSPAKGKATETIVQQIPVTAQMPQTIMTQAPAVVPAPVAQAVAPVADSPKEEDSKFITINSPMVGTFYRKSSPDKPAFVNVDDSFEPGKVICILEAMKLFNEIEAEISGKIVKVLVDDGTPVEYDQPLFLVDPS